MSTLAEFRTLVSSVVGLDNTASSAEQSLIDKWVNDGVIEVLRRTKCRVAIATETLTSGAVDYELPTGILAINRIVNADSIPLDRFSPSEILDYRRSSSISSSTYIYAVDGANLLMIWPEPTASDVLTIYYTPRPTVMTNGSHDPSSTTYGGIPSEYHRAIELYALWKAADYSDDESSKQGDRYARDFTAEINEIRTNIRSKGGRKLGPARLNVRRPFVGDPSSTLPLG